MGTHSENHSAALCRTSVSTAQSAAHTDVSVGPCVVLEVMQCSCPLCLLSGSRDDLGPPGMDSRCAVPGRRLEDQV